MTIISGHRRRRVVRPYELRCMLMLGALCVVVLLAEMLRGRRMHGRASDSRFEGWFTSPSVALWESLGQPSDRPSLTRKLRPIPLLHAEEEDEPPPWQGRGGWSSGGRGQDGAQAGSEAQGGWWSLRGALDRRLRWVVQRVQGVEGGTAQEEEAQGVLGTQVMGCDPWAGACRCLQEWLGDQARQRCEALRPLSLSAAPNATATALAGVVEVVRVGGSWGYHGTTVLAPDVYACPTQSGTLACVIQDQHMDRWGEAQLQDCEGAPSGLTRSYPWQSLITTNLHGKGAGSGFCDVPRRLSPSNPRDLDSSTDVWLGPLPQPSPPVPFPVLPLWPLSLPPLPVLTALPPAPWRSRYKGMLLVGASSQAVKANPSLHHLLETLEGAGVGVRRGLHEGFDCPHPPLFNDSRLSPRVRVLHCGVRYHALTLVLPPKGGGGGAGDWWLLWRALLLGSVPVVLGPLPPHITQLLPHRSAVVQWPLDDPQAAQDMARSLSGMLQEEGGRSLSSTYHPWKAPFGTPHTPKGGVCGLCTQLARARRGVDDSVLVPLPFAAASAVQLQERLQWPLPQCVHDVMDTYATLATLPPPPPHVRQTALPSGVKVYVLHYAGLKDRTAHVRRLAGALGGAHVVTGFDRGAQGGAQALDCVFKQGGRRGQMLTGGQQSLSMKHVSVWYHLASRGRRGESALVLEDDAAFNYRQDARDWAQAFGSAMAEVPSDFDVVFVGGCHRDFAQTGVQVVSDRVHRVFASHCTSAYVVSHQGALKLLHALLPLSLYRPIDWAMTDAVLQPGNNLTYYQLSPLPFRQVGESFSQGNTMQRGSITAEA